MYKRIIAIVLVACLSLGAFNINASAAEVAPDLMYDLMGAFEYETYYDGKLYARRPLSVGWNLSGHEWEIRWKSPLPLKVSKIVVDIVSSAKPSGVQFTNLAAEANMTYLGSYGSGQLTKYQYEIDNPALVMDYIGFIASFDTATGQGYFGVSSCIAYVDNSIPVSSVNYFSNAVYHLAGRENLDGTSYEYYERYSAGSGTASIPFSSFYNSYPEYYPDLYDGATMDFGEAYIKFSPPNGLGSLTSLDVMIHTINDPFDIGARIEKPDGTVVANLPVSVLVSGETQRLVNVLPADPIFYRTTSSTISIDLSGYSLEDYVITLYFKVEPCDVVPSMFNEYAFYWCLEGAAFQASAQEIPWYTTFGNWLSSVFKPIFDRIEGYVSNIFVRLGYFWDDFTDFAEDLLASIGFDSGEVEEFENEIADKSEEISGAGEKFDSVSKPNISPGTTDIMGSVDAQASASLNLLVTPILSNEFVLKIILMVLTFTLVSYVLFGKR